MGNGVWNFLVNVAVTGQEVGKIGSFVVLAGGLVTAIGGLGMMTKPSLKLRTGREIGRTGVLLFGGAAALLGFALALWGSGG